MKVHIFVIAGLLLNFHLFNVSLAQTVGSLQGKVLDSKTQVTLPGVLIVVEGTSPTVKGVTDLDGNFTIKVPVGSYKVVASFAGYASVTKFNVVISSGNNAYLSFEMNEEVRQTGEVIITAAPKSANANRTKIETPLSIQGLTVEEIKSNPGGNFDISKAIQVLPGVGNAAVSGGVRNDIIIRGGGPNENVYYLDGIEIPVINHFSTTGSAGGSNGILNVLFIEDVQFSSSAFNAQYDNALSSVIQFKQKEGNRERLQSNIRLSATELGLTLDGPAGPKTNYQFSLRRSYLQYLFKVIDQPILPAYWDSQFKITHKFNSKTTLNIIGVGALDDFSFTSIKKSTPDKEYNLRSLPTIKQQSYTIGASLIRSLENGSVQLALSNTFLANALDRFEDAQFGDENRRVLRTRSRENSTQLRVNLNQFYGAWKLGTGITAQYVSFGNSNFAKVQNELKDATGNVISPAVKIDFSSSLNYVRYGGFVQLSRYFFNDRLSVSGGVRTDMNSYTTSGNNPLKTLSPRISAGYSLSDEWRVSAAIGSYYKVPINNVLSFKNSDGQAVNKSNAYAQVTHYVLGTEYIPRQSTRIILEGFYKDYSNYPITPQNGLSLANQGSDFTAIGNTLVNTTGKGRTYGLELSIQQKLEKRIFYTLSYTLVRSEFTDNAGTYIPSAWDVKHLLSALVGYKFNHGWELGLKYRYAGGSPYTPFDLVASQSNYVLTGQGTLDYTKTNTVRTIALNQVDVRVDKKLNFKKFSLDLYIDVTNFFQIVGPSIPNYTFERNADNTGFVTTDGQALKNDGSNAIPKILPNDDPFFLPSFGFILDF